MRSMPGWGHLALRDPYPTASLLSAVDLPLFRGRYKQDYTFSFGTSTKRRSFQLCSAHSTSCTPLAPSSNV
jgi:hypothetical protein